jgi:hypothetical protein
VESHGRSERHIPVGREKSIILLEGSHASPARLFNEITLKVKTLEWLEAVI